MLAGWSQNYQAYLMLLTQNQKKQVVRITPNIVLSSKHKKTERKTNIKDVTNDFLSVPEFSDSKDKWTDADTSLRVYRLVAWKTAIIANKWCISLYESIASHNIFEEKYKIDHHQT